MANKSTPERPINWFERFFDFQCNFIHLNVNLGSAEACHGYHDNWIGRYRVLMNQ